MAGFGPRRPHPPPSQPSVARIAPMVPEVSLFFSNSWINSRSGLEMDRYPGEYRATIEPRGSSQPVRFQSNNSSGVNAPLDPPSPHKPVLNGLVRPTPDFSRMFDNSGNMSGYGAGYQDTNNYYERRVGFPDYVEPVNSGSNPYNYSSFESRTPEPDQRKLNRTNSEDLVKSLSLPEFNSNAPSSPLHPEILKVLSWQNEQLKLLQDQVQMLLQSSPQLNLGADEVVDIEPQTTRRNEQLKEPYRSKTMSSVSTNTSTLWPEIQRGLERLHHVIQEENEEEEENSCGITLTEMRNSNIKVNSSDGDSIRSPQPTMNIDLPDYAGSDCSPDLKRTSDKVSWESPILGESVSMYEETQDVRGVYDDIMTQVNRLLAEPPPQDTAAGIMRRPELESFVNEPESYDPATATFNRLRQLGVSFISSEELSRPRTKDLGSQEYSNMFLPRAASPSKSLWRNSPDTSLEISSLALKYLDETQLSKLADKHRAVERRTLTSVTISDNDVNMSMATQEFLNRHGLNTVGSRNPLRSIDNVSRTRSRQASGNQGFELRKEVLRESTETRYRVQENLEYRTQQEIRVQSGNTVQEQTNQVQYQQTVSNEGPKIGYTNSLSPNQTPRVQQQYQPQPRRNVRLMEPENNLTSNPTSSSDRELKSRAIRAPCPGLTNRVLDINAIRQQPKFL